MKQIDVVNAVRMTNIRTRFIDEALERAVADGATQLAILGAGFDSHAYRCRELLARVSIFEVDRRAMQDLKRARVREVLGAPPANLTYVEADFLRDDLRDVLPRHGFNPRQKTFFIFEGVTMYLPEEAVRRTLRFAAASPPGSAIVFDFVYQSMIDAITRIDITTVPEAAKAFVERSCRSSAARRALSHESRRHAGRRGVAEAMARMVASASRQARRCSDQMRQQQRLMSHQVAVAIVPTRR
jgi:methyltransferase (TIGR00027 family)